MPPCHGMVSLSSRHELRLRDIEGIQAWDHSGGCIVLLGVRRCRCHWNIIEGIGPDYISPFDNGSDFGITCQPTDNSVGWIFENDFENNRIFNTASGIQSVMMKTHRLSKNHIGPVCGEHCVYWIELDGVHSEGNYLHDAPTFAWKTQLENYAGRFVGEAFVAVRPTIPVSWCARSAYFESV